MQKNTIHPKTTNTYNENGLTLTELIQQWLDENCFLGNLDIDTTNIKYKCTNK